MEVVSGAVGKLKGKAHRVGSRLGKHKGRVGMGIAGVVPGRAIGSIHKYLGATKLHLVGHDTAILGAPCDSHAQSSGVSGGEEILR